MHNATLGDTRVIDGRAIIPIQLPLIPPLQSKLGARRRRLFGEGTIISRRYGSSSLWADTPLSSSPVIGDVKVYSLDDIFSRWDDVGFNWNFKDNRLEAYLTTNGQTYKVLVPASKIKEIFNGVSQQMGLKKSCLCKHKGNLKSMLETTAAWLNAVPKVGAPFGIKIPTAPIINKQVLEQAVAQGRAYRATLTPAELAEVKRKSAIAATAYRDRVTKAKAKRAWQKKCSGGFDLECFVSDVSNEIANAPRKIAEGVESFFQDPVKWVEHASRDLGKFIDDVGMVALDVVSHPIFTGIATALSVIPPLMAVGAAGLAASAAANAIKPALKAVSAAAKAVEGVAATAQDPAKVIALAAGAAGISEKTLTQANSMVNGFKSKVVNLPKPAQNVVVAALQSTPGVKTPTPVVAQFAPEGISLSVYSAGGPTQGTVKAAIFGLPQPIQKLWAQALKVLNEDQRIVLGYALQEPLNGRNAWEAIYKAPERSKIRLAITAIKSLKGTAGQQFASHLMRAYG